MSYSSEVMADSPIGRWRLGEPSGTTTVDASGNGRDGAYSGSVTLNQASLLLTDADKCADFSGGKSIVPNTGSWANQSVFTVEAWIQADSFAGYNFVVAQDADGTDGWWLVVKGSKVTGLIQGHEFSGATTLSTATTYHIALTYDGTTAKVYLNGVSDGTLTVTADPSTFHAVYIGDWETISLPFDGRIDEVAYYSSALSGARIAAHYAAGTSVTPADATVAPPVATATATAVAPTVSNGSGNATVSPPAATATATALAPTITQIIPAGTDTSNSLNGRRRRARASVVVTRPAAAVPSRAAVKYDKSVPYPPPTLVNGRPT